MCQSCTPTSALMQHLYGFGVWDVKGATYRDYFKYLWMVLDLWEAVVSETHGPAKTRQELLWDSRSQLFKF